MPSPVLRDPFAEHGFENPIFILFRAKKLYPKAKIDIFPNSKLIYRNFNRRNTCFAPENIRKTNIKSRIL